MKKCLMTICLALFVVGMFFSAIAMAGSAKCKVESVSGSKLILDCGSDADDFNAGDRVKVKRANKRKTIEGC